MTKITLGYEYQSLRSNLRGYYLGRQWHGALRALDVAADLHKGQRKNGEPEFSHQVFQAQYCRTLDRMLIDPEGTHITILYHDAPEDHNYPFKMIEQDLQRVMGPSHITDIVRSIERMTDETETKVEKEEVFYYDQIGSDVRASAAKGIDRFHNHQSMMGTFTFEKQNRYIGTTEALIIPMLKRARKLFPEQEPVYQNIKQVLLTQMDLIRQIHASHPSAGDAVQL